MNVPSDVQAEEAVLAACLVEPGLIPEVSAIVRPEDFYREHNGWAFEAVLEVWRKGDEAVNTITVAREMAARDRLEEFGGLSRLSEYVRQLPTSVGAESYAELVRNASRARKAIGLISQAQREIATAPNDVDDLLDKHLERLLSASSDRPRAITRTLADVLTEHLEDIDRFLERPGEIRGIACGIPEIDLLLNGILKGAVISVQADTSLGKSLLTHDILRRVSLAGTPCLLVTTEMPNREVAERLVFQEARVDPYLVRVKGSIEMDGRTNVQEAVATLVGSPAPVYLCDKGGIQLATLQAETRRLARTRGVQVVVVDHIQHVRVGKLGLTERIPEVTNGLKELAIDEQVGVIAVSHITRDAQNNGIRHNSGKGGTSIEQDADVVLTLEAMTWITDEYGGSWEPAPKQLADGHLSDHGWIPIRATVQKGRAGGTQSVMLRLDWRFEGGRFLPMDGAA